MPLIQQSATSESFQQVIFLIGISHFRAPSTALANLATMTAAGSSNLGIVWLLSGATLVTDSFYRMRLLASSLTPIPGGPWDCL